MIERPDSRIRLTTAWSSSDAVIFLLALVLMVPWVLPDGLVSELGPWVLLFIMAYPLVTGIAWYTALRNARGEPMPGPTAFLSALGASVIAVVAGYVNAFGLIPAIVGVVMGVGTVRGLSLLRALALVPLVVVLVVGTIEQPPII